MSESEKPKSSPLPDGYEKIRHTPMGETEGWTVLGASASAAGAVALVTIIAEIATDGALARILGLGVFISLPIGLGATFLTGLVARNAVRRALIPGALVLLYWAAYFIATFA